MSARDDYPYLASLPNAAGYGEGAKALDEIDHLRRWKVEATTVLSDWEAVWEAAGSPGPLGGSKAAAVSVLIEQLGREIAKLDSEVAKLAYEIDRP